MHQKQHAVLTGNADRQATRAAVPTPAAAAEEGCAEAAAAQEGADCACGAVSLAEGLVQGHPHQELPKPHKW